MARLPQPGGDKGIWGGILNDFLAQEHNADGTLKKAGDIADAQSKADSAVQSVNAITPDGAGSVVIAKSDVGLGNVDNTSDANKPVSTDQAAANIADRNRANHTGTQLLATISDVTASATEVNYTDGVTSAIQTQLNSKAALADLDAHITDATDAHDASAISFVPTGTVAATNMQAAIDEVAAERGIVAITQAAYDALPSPDPTTLYVIVP